MTRRTRILFWILGIAQCVAWLVFARISQSFEFGLNHTQRPLLPILGVMASAFLLYLVCVLRFWNEKKWPGTGPILLLSVLLRVPLIFWSNPVQEIDYYRYLWDGRTVLSHVSPYQFSPADLDEWRKQNPETRPATVAGLITVLDSSRAIDTLFKRIDHREVPTVYPPMSQLVFALAAWATPAQSPLSIHLIVIRGLMAALDLGIVILLLIWLRCRHLPLGRALVYAWCPLVLKEFSNSGHMDVIAVFLVTACWLLLSINATNPSKWPGWRVVMAALLWSGAVLAKWYPLVLGPVLLSFGWKKWRWRFAPATVLALTLIGVGFQFSRPKIIQQGEASTHHGELAGLRTFLTRWEMNDLAFGVIRENLNVRQTGKDILKTSEPWYSVVPQNLRLPWDSFFRNIASRRGVDDSATDPAFLTAQIISGLGVLGMALWFSLRPWPLLETGEALGRRFFLVLATFWYLSATQNPWYWTWALPFAIFARSRIWLLVSGASLIYYLRFWLIYHYPSPFWRGLSGERIFDEIIVWFEHLPILLLLLFSGINSGTQASNKKRWNQLLTRPHSQSI